jgi:hypothetical protein
MFFLHFASIITVLANIALGIFVLSKNPKAQLNRVFFVLCLFVALWVGSNYLFLITAYIPANKIFAETAFVSGSFIAYFFLQFSFILTKSPLSRKSLFFLLIPPFIFSILFLGTELFISGYRIVNNRCVGIYNRSIIFFGLFFLTYFVIAFKKIITTYKKVKGLLRARLSYFLVGAVIASLAGISTNLVRSITDAFNITKPIGMFILISGIGPLFTLFFVGFTAYAITRYRLFGIRVILRKGTTYLILGLILLAFYAYIFILLSQFFLKEFFQKDPYLYTFLLAILFALSYEPLKRLVKKWVDRIFFPKFEKEKKIIRQIKSQILPKVDLYKISQELAQAVKKLVSVEEVKVLIVDRKAPEFFQIYPKAKFSPLKLSSSSALVKHAYYHPEILVKDEIPYMLDNISPFLKDEYLSIHKELKKLKAELVIPLAYDGTIRGFILTSSKMNGEAFTEEEIKNLEEIRLSLTAHLDGALMYKYTLENEIEEKLKIIKKS